MTMQTFPTFFTTNALKLCERDQSKAITMKTELLPRISTADYIASCNRQTTTHSQQSITSILVANVTGTDGVHWLIGRASCL